MSITGATKSCQKELHSLINLLYKILKILFTLYNISYTVKERNEITLIC